MKRYFVTVSLLLLSRAFGMYMGNPYLPEFPKEGVLLSKEFPVSLKVGYQGAFIYERGLKLDQGFERSISKKETLKYHTNQAVVSVGFWDRLEVFAGLGAGQFWFCGPIDDSVIKTLTHENFLWEAGGRALLIFWKETALGVSAGYQAAYPDLDSLTINETPESTSRSTVRYSQWQAAISISHKVGILSPYIGGSYSYLKYRETLPYLQAHFGDHEYHQKYKARHKISLVVGGSITGVSGMNLDIEFKTFAEKSVTACANFRF